MAEALIVAGITAVGSIVSSVIQSSNRPSISSSPTVPTFDAAADNAKQQKKADEKNRKRAGREDTRKRQTLTSESDINKPKLTLGE